jgi:signal transduction histidine kinase
MLSFSTLGISSPVWGMRVEFWGTGLESGWAVLRAVEVAAVVLVLAAVARSLQRARRDERARSVGAARILGQARAAADRDEQQRAEVRHDAANSLAAIRSAVVLLEDPRYHSTDRLRLALDRELKHLERLVLGPAEETVDFPVDELVRDAALLSRAQGLDVSVRTRPAVAHGRPADVRRAVENLLANAGRHGGGAVHVDVRQAAAGVEVAVTDQGAGVPEALSESLFERGASAGATSGSGLGPHVSRRLMRSQQGELSVRPGGAGTTFALSLPEAQQSTSQSDRFDAIGDQR